MLRKSRHGIECSISFVYTYSPSKSSPSSSKSWKSSSKSSLSSLKSTGLMVEGFGWAWNPRPPRHPFQCSSYKCLYQLIWPGWQQHCLFLSAGGEPSSLRDSSVLAYQGWGWAQRIIKLKTRLLSSYRRDPTRGSQFWLKGKLIVSSQGANPLAVAAARTSAQPTVQKPP